MSSTVPMIIADDEVSSTRVLPVIAGSYQDVSTPIKVESGQNDVGVSDVQQVASSAVSARNQGYPSFGQRNMSRCSEMTEEEFHLYEKRNGQSRRPRVREQDVSQALP